MQVKTFEGFSIKDTVKAVKAEFGQDAVILNTREKKVDEKNHVYEVTAAIAETPRDHGASAMANHQAMQPQIKQLEDQLSAMDLRLQNITDNLPRRSEFNAIESGMEELKTLLLEALRTKDGNRLSHLPKEFVALHQQLSLMGVDESHLANLFRYLQDLPGPEKESNKVPEKQADYYRSKAIRWMLKRISIAPKWSSMKGSLQVHGFMGPSGSGKTTAIAKLAAKIKKHRQYKPLLVCHDSTKLGSSEQLKLYAKILDIPCAVIEDPSELEAAIEAHKDVNLVLLDTAGRSPKNAQHISELNGFNEISIPIDFHLVLSITEKETQLDRAIRNYSSVGIASLMFSKLDETWSYGEIFNLSNKWSIPLSYFATGNRIPDDIERASKERVIERIFSI